MKIGSVPYLNARPLVDWLERRPQPEIDVSYATPSVLIERLLQGDIDIAMASTFAILDHPEWHLLPGLGVTTTGPALSVRLLSRVPVNRIKTLALDCSSRSSVVLARIILADRYGVIPTIIPHTPDLDQMLAVADAAVLIGDIGMTVSGNALVDLDLGQEWWQLTGLPFYFAGWIARDKTRLEQAAPLLYDACDHGLARLQEIAVEEAIRLHCSVDLCYHYLADVMRYRTGEAERAGLEEFRRRAQNLGILSPLGSKIPTNRSAE